MGFRFRRSFGIIPGVRINVGRRGPSLSLGVRGAHVTVGPTGVRQTVGIPGTGMSYTSHEGWAEHASPNRQTEEADVPPRGGGAAAGWIVAFVLFVILIAVLASS